MDIQINNATLEEITIICNRLASPSFYEMESEPPKLEDFLPETKQEKPKETEQKSTVKTKTTKEEVAQAYSLEEIQALATEYVKRFGSKRLSEVLDTGYQIKSIFELKEAEYSNFVSRLDKELKSE